MQPKLALRHAIEVGHVFKLGTKYSEALAARFLDAQEQLRPIIMGCYGIGINRIIAGLIETSHDDNGHHLAGGPGPLRSDAGPGEGGRRATDAGGRRNCTTHLRPRGIDVLLDDRDYARGREVQGRRPDRHSRLRVVIGERGLKQGKLEIKWRWDEKAEMIDLKGAAESIAERIRLERASGERFGNWQRNNHPRKTIL